MNYEIDDKVLVTTFHGACAIGTYLGLDRFRKREYVRAEWVKDNPEDYWEKVESSYILTFESSYRIRKVEQAFDGLPDGYFISPPDL